MFFCCVFFISSSFLLFLNSQNCALALQPNRNTFVVSVHLWSGKARCICVCSPFTMPLGRDILRSPHVHVSHRAFHTYFQLFCWFLILFVFGCVECMYVMLYVFVFFYGNEKNVLCGYRWRWVQWIFGYGLAGCIWMHMHCHWHGQWWPTILHWPHHMSNIFVCYRETTTVVAPRIHCVHVFDCRSEYTWSECICIGMQFSLKPTHINSGMIIIINFHFFVFVVVRMES